MHILDWTQLFRRERCPRRWINAPFVLVLATLTFLGLASGESAASLWPYEALLAIFLIQLARPTLFGWAFSIVAWLGIAFGYFLYERIALGIGFSALFLSVWGLLPVAVLWFANPRTKPSTATK